MKRDILSFMYAERLKSALMVAGQLLDALAELDSAERVGGMKMLACFFRGVGGEVRLAASVMETEDWRSLYTRLKLMEGYARLGEMESARQELSGILSGVTTLSHRAMTSLESGGLL